VSLEGSLPRLLAALAVGVSALAGCERSPRPSNPSYMPRPDQPAPRAPETFRVRFETSRGPFVVEAHRNWSPHGVDRFYQLVSSGFYDGVRFFRVIPGFVAQFGIHGDPTVAAAWENMVIPDDSVVQSNTRGTISFATAGPNTRTTQLFINYRDNLALDRMGFSPIATVIEGMNVVDSLYGGYGDGPPDGRGPDQGRITREGNRYLEREFPKLDFIRTARIVDEPRRP